MALDPLNAYFACRSSGQWQIAATNPLEQGLIGRIAYRSQRDVTESWFASGGLSRIRRESSRFPISLFFDSFAILRAFCHSLKIKERKVFCKKKIKINTIELCRGIVKSWLFTNWNFHFWWRKLRDYSSFLVIQITQKLSFWIKWSENDPVRI